MIYLTVPPVIPDHVALVARGEIGVMLTPRVGRTVEAAKAWPVCSRVGYDSCDGTLIRFGPDQNLPRIIRWMKWSAGRKQMDMGW